MCRERCLVQSSMTGYEHTVSRTKKEKHMFWKTSNEINCWIKEILKDSICFKKKNEGLSHINLKHKIRDKDVGTDLDIGWQLVTKDLVRFPTQQAE